MKTFRARLFSSVLLALLALTAAVQPAIAQSKGGQPSQKRHQKIPPGKDCSSCHKKTYAEWKAGPHGVNDVQCTVCHGNVPESVMAKPALSVCDACHAELVAQLKADPFMNRQRKTCVTCHPPHALKPHHVASAGK